MTTPEQVVESAREELGVRYRHLGRQSGIILDCIGLLRVVAEKLELPHSHDTQNYSRYPRNGKIITELSKAGLTRMRGLEPVTGSVGIFWLTRPDQPTHCCIFTTPKTIIHTYGPPGPGKVVETTYDQYWKDRLFCWMQFQGVEY